MPITRLNLSNCIVIGDARRLQNQQKPLRNIRRLSIEMTNLYPDRYEVDVLYPVLWRSERIGIQHINDQMVQDVQDILLVTESELIKYGGN